MNQPVDKTAVWIVGSILFVAMAFTLPVLYYMFVYGGIMTYATLVMMSLPILLQPIKAILGGGGLFDILHLLVYGGILFGVAAIAARLLCRCPFKLRIPILGAMLLLLLQVSGLEIFGYLRHGGNNQSLNAYGMWSEVWDETREVLANMDR